MRNSSTSNPFLCAADFSLRQKSMLAVRQHLGSCEVGVRQLQLASSQQAVSKQLASSQQAVSKQLASSQQELLLLDHRQQQTTTPGVPFVRQTAFLPLTVICFPSLLISIVQSAGSVHQHLSGPPILKGLRWQCAPSQQLNCLFCILDGALCVF